jgi:hypothetical protein
MAIAAAALLTLGGCPAGGFFGRFIVLNTSGATVNNLMVSHMGQSVTFAGATIDSQGWVLSAGMPGGVAAPKAKVNAYVVEISWTDSSGKAQQVTIDFKANAGYRCEDDLLVELEGGAKGTAHSWRISKAKR